MSIVRPQFIRPGGEESLYGSRECAAGEVLADPQAHNAPDERTSFVYNRHHHLPLETQRQRLPVFQYRQHILRLLETHQTLVLVGETGSGKSTQVPQYACEVGHKVCVTQPRVAAAVALASRVAEERGERVGGSVGYAAGAASCRLHSTDIVFVTEGVLLREMFASPLLTQYSCIVLDEVHERTQLTDVLMGLLKKILRKRKKLKLVVSSATMDAEFLRDFFNLRPGGESTSVIMSVQGRTHQIDIFYVQEPVPDYVKATVDTVVKIHENKPFGDILAFLTSQEEILSALETLEEYAASSGERRRGGGGGGGGAYEMSVLPMYGSLPHYRQLKVFQMADKNVRKVILATNIAETSITVPGITYVIDCGFHKLPYLDPSLGVQCVGACAVSRANAVQRAGRAGRTGRGECYRLYSEEEFDKMAACVPPEMQRSELSSVVLQLKALGIHNVLRFTFPTPPPARALPPALELLIAFGALDREGQLTEGAGQHMAELPLTPTVAEMLCSSERFTFPTPPPARALLSALELLITLGALDREGQLTEGVGQHMAELPLTPTVARMLCSSGEYGCIEEMLSIVAMLQVESVFVKSKSGQENIKAKISRRNNFEVAEGDLLTLLNVYDSYDKMASSVSEKQRGKACRAWCQKMYVNERAMEKVVEIRKSLAKLVKDKFMLENKKCEGLEFGSAKTERVLKCITSGLFPHAVRLSASGEYRSVACDAALHVAPDSCLYSAAPPQWLVYCGVQSAGDKRFMRLLTAIRREWLLDVAPHYYRLT